MCSLLLFSSSFIYAEESWNTYIAQYEEYPGSISLRMDLIDNSPIEEYKYVLVTGIKYNSNRKDGFPEQSTFDLLHEVNDSILEEISKTSDYIFTGSFTYKFFRYDYIYIKNIQNLEKLLKEFYENHYSDQEYYINIAEDPQWEYYREFLYPNEQMLNYMSDRDVVYKLIEAGDKLKKERRVDHWLYFKTEEDRENFIKELHVNNFTVELAGKSDYKDFPFSLIIWREDKVDLNSINVVTSLLNELAQNHHGNYDGWETYVVKE